MADELYGVDLVISPQRVWNDESVTVTAIVNHPYLKPEAKFHSCFNYAFTSSDPRLNSVLETLSGRIATFRMPLIPDGEYDITAQVTRKDPVFEEFIGHHAPLSRDQILSETKTVRLVSRSLNVRAGLYSERMRTDDEALCAAIRNRTAAIAFPRYQRFINSLMHRQEGRLLAAISTESVLTDQAGGAHKSSTFGPNAYSELKLATQAFLTMECGVVLHKRACDRADLFYPEHEQIRFGDPSIGPDEISRMLERYLGSPDSTRALPYLKKIAEAFISLDGDSDRDPEGSPYAQGILEHRLTAPAMIELIWSYWLEEGMLVQTMNAIAWRFQNRRGGPQDPLGELEFDSLRPLSNILWGFIQDQQNRLTVQRRAYEYHHHYGLSLEGKAVGEITPADTRSKFIEAFHNLLYRADLFYRDDRDMTKQADGFTLLNALKEVHIILAEGAHNQFGDLTWTARAEMLTMQWMLARPEMREFLRGRYAVPYQELWMGAVDSMKKLQGWSDTSIMHFHELAVTGERILLSIRYGHWTDISNMEEQAKNWARDCKPEIQRYLHSYRTVTGADLSADTTDKQEASKRLMPPSALLKERLLSQHALAAPIAARRPLRGLTAASPTGGAAPARQQARLSKLT